MDLVLNGACGRMGKEVLKAASTAPGVRIAAALERAGHPQGGEDAGLQAGLSRLGVAVTTDAAAAVKGRGVVIDFSTVEGSASLLDALEAFPLPSVVGVTGLPAAVRARWEAIAGRTAVIVAPNLSMGAAVLRRLSGIAARALPGFDVEIVEAHHRGKADAPSGTAIAVLDSVARAREIDPAASTVHGRRPGEGPRRPGTIGVHAVRGGSVTGDHTVMLLGDHERIEIRHVAESREIFARGAIAAALWLEKNGPGLFTMDDVVSSAAHG